MCSTATITLECKEYGTVYCFVCMSLEVARTCYLCQNHMMTCTHSCILKN
jgi:hypothetical protein